MGFLAAVAFATILAVVSGLTLAGASALSHDLYVGVIRRGEASERDEVRVAKGATVLLGITAMALAILFKGQNVAFMVGLAFAVACSANFPALLMSILWKKFTTAGAVLSIITGLVLAAGMIFLSPTVWVEVIHKADVAAVGKNVAGIDAAMKAKVADIEKQTASAKAAVEQADKDMAAMMAPAAPAAKGAKTMKKSTKAEAEAKTKMAAIDKQKADATALIAKADADTKAAKDEALSLTTEAKKAMPKAIFPYRNPAIFSMTAAFLIGIFASLIAPDKEAEKKFAGQKVREYIALGAED